MKNKTTYIFVILFLSVLIYSCSNLGKDNADSKSELSAPDEQLLAEGFQLAENNCFTCHSPNASIENRVAPPMEAIKRHYIKSNVSNEAFTQELISFLNNPSEEKSKMPGAVKRFNLMPKMNFSNEQISKIATYIYYSEIEKPDWFENHYQQEKKKYGRMDVPKLSPLEQGQMIALKTKGVLGKNLLNAINTSGTENALSFCSTRAIPLTDSMATSLHATIRRVSDKNRNPDNKANQDELSYIEAIKLLVAQGKKPEPQLNAIGNKQVGYYPIMTNKMCMQCHGQPNTEILPNTLTAINKLYPNDLATGYKIDELRGIWVVEMEKQ